MIPLLEASVNVTEHMPVKTTRNPDGSVLVLHADTGIEIFCSLPPSIENSGRPVAHPNNGAIKGNRADVQELIRIAAGGNSCPMDDFPAYLEHGYYMD